MMVTTPTAKYTGLEITNLNGDLVGISALTFHVSGVNVAVNQATTGSLLNWTLVTGSGVPTFTSALNGGASLQLSGYAQLNVAGFVAAAGHFDITKTTVSG